MPTRKQVAQKLLEGHDENEIVAVSIFTVNDVLGLDDELFEKEAEEILENVHKNQSAETGITWASLLVEIDNRRLANYDLESKQS